MWTHFTLTVSSNRPPLHPEPDSPSPEWIYAPPLKPRTPIGPTRSVGPRHRSRHVAPSATPAPGAPEGEVWGNVPVCRRCAGSVGVWGAMYLKTGPLRTLTNMLITQRTVSDALQPMECQKYGCFSILSTSIHTFRVCSVRERSTSSSGTTSMVLHPTLLQGSIMLGWNATCRAKRYAPALHEWEIPWLRARVLTDFIMSHIHPFSTSC